MFKTGEFKGSKRATPVDYGSVFETEHTTGPDRLRIGYGGSARHPFEVLLPCLSGPFGILYLLHTPRGGAQPGRYQSPKLTEAQVTAFLTAHKDFFALDARHDIWLHDLSTSSTLVWDRHDVVYAYGLLDEFRTALLLAGFSAGKVSIPNPHCHNYHEAFDKAETEVLKEFEWRHTPLETEDEQFEVLKGGNSLKNNN